MTTAVNPAVRRHLMLAKLESFNESELFRNVADPDMDWLTRAATARTFEANHLLLSPTHYNEAIFWLKRGHVEMSRIARDGERGVVTVIQPGNLFGHMPLLGMSLHGIQAVTVDDCNILILGRPELERALLERPHLALKFLDLVGRRLIEAEARLEDITFKSIPGRLASLLLRLSPNGGGRVMGYTHQDLAEMIGTYRETTTQTLNQFKSKGLVEIGRKRIEIRDSDALRQLAEK